MAATRISNYWRKIGFTDNLAELSNLVENTILEELKSRYSRDVIYTYVGDILISVNPYKELSIYSKQVSFMYKSAKLFEKEPHIYAIASHVYRCMLGTDFNPEPSDQCIVISGESGSGKTESTKLVVKQIIEICNGATQLEQQILQVNPLLEAFGNAKTVMNDNSSRFGKYIQLQFHQGKVEGAKISDYLLEKSRIVQQNPGDENFHIFSYMFAGFTEEQRQLYQLRAQKSYRYIRSYTANSRIDLKKEYDELLNAMDLVGFSELEQTELFSVLSGVLAIGNVTFSPLKGDDEAVGVASSEYLEIAAELFGVDSSELKECLISLINNTRGETVRITYNKLQAEDSRDAVAKVIYGRLFSWIVNKINQGLAAPHNSQHELREIGILDIFGFENFQMNSFEQACINLANEHLQYFFNEHIFSLEQEEYKLEGVKWANITYCDNQALLDLFLKRPIGILALLDEESHFPQATDVSFVRKLNENLKSSTCYVSHKSVSVPSFTVNHYAGAVNYTVSNWLEKNRDTTPPTLTSILKSSKNSLLRTIFRGTVTRTGTLALQNRTKSVNKAAKPSNTKKFTVGTQFKNSLQDLIKHMSQAEPKFIRCIKPNNNQASEVFDDSYVLAQLSYTGMLQTVQIRRDGYPFRPLITDFLETYGMLLLRPVQGSEPDLCKEILRESSITDFCIGKTKLFLKFGHNEVLTAKAEKLKKIITTVQSVIRGFLARRYVSKLREASRIQRAYVLDFLQTIQQTSEDLVTLQLENKQLELEERERRRAFQKQQQEELERQQQLQQRSSQRPKPALRKSSPTREGPPPRPPKSDRLSQQYGHAEVNPTTVPGEEVKRRTLRSPSDKLPPLPATPLSPSSVIHAPQTIAATADDSSAILRAESSSRMRQQRDIKMKYVQAKFAQLGYGSISGIGDDDDEVLEDDYSKAQELLDKSEEAYGPANSRAATVEWFKRTQLHKLRDPNADGNKLYDWLHGIIKRGKAERLLMGMKAGSFMVRVSERRLGYVLSFKAEGRCRNYLIDLTPSQKYYVVGEPKVHPTLYHLVAYYRSNHLSNWPHLLTYPCGQVDSDNPDYMELLVGNTNGTPKKSSPTQQGNSYQPTTPLRSSTHLHPLTPLTNPPPLPPKTLIRAKTAQAFFNYLGANARRKSNGVF